MHLFFYCLTLYTLAFFCHFSPLFGEEKAQQDPKKSDENRCFVFPEIWGYLYSGEERFLPKNSSISDLLYFGARVTSEGKLSSLPLLEKLSSLSLETRKHLVVAGLHNALEMEPLLRKKRPERRRLLQELRQASTGFDGLQINFETLRPEEGPAFLAFLQDLRALLGKKKILSVALVAKLKESHDAFCYSSIAKIADRIIVMAYNHHSLEGKHGPIAPQSWIQKIATYAQAKIAKEKLVLALPLYGYLWPLQPLARACRYDFTQKLLQEKAAKLQRLPDGTPFFFFEERLQAVCFFEDMQSLQNKLSLCERMQIRSVAFWRIGQGPSVLWQRLSTPNKVLSR